MLAEVKKCAESHDVRGLRYIFLDSLDVDPTFEKYREDYEFCKCMDGLFEDHRDLNGLFEDKSRWTLEYWNQLKMDLIKNFSQKRFEHMIQVAQVVYAEKIARLVIEREERQRSQKRDAINNASTMVEQRNVTENVPAVTIEEDREGILNAASEQQRIEAKRRALEEENRKIEIAQKAQRERIEAARQAEILRKSNRTGDQNTKKIWGIALVIVIVVVLAFIIIMLH